jgi:CRP-like cAMP-binding protein
MARAVTLVHVRRNRLLAALRAGEISLLVPDLREMTLTMGDVLQEPGEPVTQICFPGSGMVSLLTVMEDGSSVETALVGREGAAGIMAALGSRRATSRWLVQHCGIALCIDAEKFQSAVRRNQTIRDLTIRYADALRAMIQQSAGCHALHSVEERFCRWLLEMHDRTDDGRLSLTQEFLAGMLGVHRPTVTLVARRLQSDGSIHYRRGTIEITDRSKIEERACECYWIARARIGEVFGTVKDQSRDVLAC